MCGYFHSIIFSWECVLFVSLSQVKAAKNVQNILKQKVKHTCGRKPHIEKAREVKHMPSTKIIYDDLLYSLYVQYCLLKTLFTVAR